MLTHLLRKKMHTLVLFFILTSLSQTSSAFLLGDVAPLDNPDGRVTVADALVTLRIGLGLVTGDYPQCDVAPLGNPDGKVTVADALVVLRAGLGLIEIPVPINDRDGDGVADEDDFFPDDPTASTVPKVTITSPQSLITVGASPITLIGTIDDPNATLTINDIPVQHSAGSYTADVALTEGSNSIVVRAVDSSNHEGTATITVSLDKTPPSVTIQSFEDGATVFTDTVAIGGLVNDIVRGTISDVDAIVTVNGMNADVLNRSYLAANVPLQEGSNSITVIASDAVGNVGQTQITLIYAVQHEKKITLIQGQGQTNEIYSGITQALTIQLTDNDQPVTNKNVVFRVIEGDGKVHHALNAPTDQALLTTTNQDGIAEAYFQLGSRAGKGIHRVKASAVGFDGEVIFHASADPRQGDKLGIIAGNNQRGSVRQGLPSPLVVAVTDNGSNLIEGAQVAFEVTQGTGKFSNGEPTQIVSTDKDGRASAAFTLGAEEGLDGQRVIARLANTLATAGFTASGFIPSDPANTIISGVVLDNQDNPLAGVTVRIDNSNRQAISDDHGLFSITQAPVGPVHILADGSTTTAEGEWPTLSYNLVTVSGVDNPLSSPIYLVRLDTDNKTVIDPSQDQILTLDEVPGFKLEVTAGSVTFPDGSKNGSLSITPVNANKIPMAPPNGMQPQFIVTIQPHGATFDPPAKLTLPNVDGHAPGAEVEMYSFDHDLEEFVTIGLGTVSTDGSVIESNIGVGVIKAGWHCGSQPGGSGCLHDCPLCKDCDGDCNCVGVTGPDPRLTQTVGDCKKTECNNGDVSTVDDDSDTPKDKECKLCDAGEPVNAVDGSHPGGNLCKTCLLGVAVNKPTAAGIATTREWSFPSDYIDTINLALKPLRGTLTAPTVTLTGKISECCLPTTGNVIPGKVEVSGQAAIGLSFGLRIWPPGPKFEAGVAVNFFGLGVIKVSFELDGGVFVEGATTFGGEAKIVTDVCNGGQTCLSAKIGYDFTPSLRVGLDAKYCTYYDCFFCFRPVHECLSVSLTAVKVSWKFCGGVSYDSCANPTLSGVGITNGGLTISLGNLSASVEDKIGSTKRGFSSGFSFGPYFASSNASSCR